MNYLPDHFYKPYRGEHNNYIVLDFETTNTLYGDAVEESNKLLLSCFILGWDESSKVYHIDGGEFDIPDLVELCENNILVAHNAKMELKWLSRAGMDLTKARVWCTMVGEHVIAGNRSVTKGLGDVAERYGYGTKEPYIDALMRSGVCPSSMPFSFVLDRCAKDVYQTHNIFKEQLKIMTELDLLEVMHTRMLLTPVLASIEMQGMKLDKDRVTEEFNSVQKELAEVEQDLNQITGGINLNSPLQRGTFLYETLKFSEPKDRRGKPLRTASGGYRTDTGTVMNLKPRNKRQREFLDLYLRRARLNSDMVKTLSKFKECVDNGDLLHAQFNQAITKTHRLSSNGTKYSLQFQNLPRHYRDLFIPRDTDNYSIGEADGSQLEFRVAVYLGQDPQGYEDIANSVDVHSYTAQVITDSGQPTSRNEAKAHTFKPLYGGNSGTDAEVAYYTAFKEKYCKITETQESWKQEVLRNKKLRLASGMIAYWEDTMVTGSGYITNSTTISNLPVQSLATAEIIPIAVVALWYGLKYNKMMTTIINTIHDSVVYELHKDEHEEVKELCKNAFTTIVYTYLDRVYNIQFNVPLAVEMASGTRWGYDDVLPETEYEVAPPFPPPTRDKEGRLDGQENSASYDDGFGDRPKWAGST